MNMKCIAALVALTLAAACGGGDGGQGSGEPAESLVKNWQRYLAGNSTLDITAAQARAALVAADARTTHELDSILTCVESPGGTCDPTYTVGLYRVPADEQGGTLAAVDGLTVTPVLQHGDIPLVKAEYQFDVEIFEEVFQGSAQVYGGWLDYTLFGTVRVSGTETGEDNFIGTQTSAAFSGSASESRPTGTGSATWTGLMAGMEDVEAIIHTEPDVFLGDARITIDDLAAPDADVSFTNIWNVTDQTPQPDMAWSGLSVTNEGVFSDGDYDFGFGNDYIAGAFTGPDHQEVGGEFRKSGIVGSFGAKR